MEASTLSHVDAPQTPDQATISAVPPHQADITAQGVLDSGPNRDPSQDHSLADLFRLLPADPDRGIPLLYFSDLKLACEQVDRRRPTSSGWFDEAWLQLTAIARPPGQLMSRSIQRVADVEFDRMVGFSPSDVDRFAQWAASGHWVADLRVETVWLTGWLDANPYWTLDPEGDGTWRSDSQAVVETNPQGPLPPEGFPRLRIHDEIVEVAELNEHWLPEPFVRSESALNLVGIEPLLGALEGDAMFAWLLPDAPEIGWRDNVAPSDSAEPLIGVQALALAAVVGVDGQPVTAVFVVNDSPEIAARNAQPLARNLQAQVERYRGEDAEVRVTTVDGRILRVETNLPGQHAQRAVTRVDTELLSAVGASPEP